MTTHALPPLPEPLKEVAVAGYHDGTLRPAMEEYFDADQMRAYAIAALSALPAGGEPEQFYRDECALYRGKIDLLMAEVAEADDEGRAFIHKDTIVGIITHEQTTPPADADVGAQGDGGGCVLQLDADDWNPYELLDIARLYVENSSGLEAGDELFIDRIKECLLQQKRTQRATPAAGKGVDDAMVERACAESWPEARFTVEAMTDWPHADPLRRGHHQRVVRAALEAALTRQPVAGDNGNG